MSTTISIKNLEKKYFSKVALRQVDLDLTSGNIYGLLGPNGSGKTTLMKVIAGLHKHSSGHVTIDGEPISYKTKAKVVFMPTDDYLYPFMKIKSIIKYYNDMYNDFDIDKAYSLLKKMELDPENRVSDLSTGLKGRLKVVICVSRKAPIYMFDEPLNGLDPISRDAVLDMLMEAVGDAHLVLVSSHLVGELERGLDKVIFLKDGNIALQGNVEDIRFSENKSIEELYKEVFTLC